MSYRLGRIGRWYALSRMIVDPSDKSVKDIPVDPDRSPAGDLLDPRPGRGSTVRRMRPGPVRPGVRSGSEPPVHEGVALHPDEHAHRPVNESVRGRQILCSRGNPTVKGRRGHQPTFLSALNTPTSKARRARTRAVGFAETTRTPLSKGVRQGRQATSGQAPPRSPSAATRPTRADGLDAAMISRRPGTPNKGKLAPAAWSPAAPPRPGPPPRRAACPSTATLGGSTLGSCPCADGQHHQRRQARG